MVVRTQVTPRVIKTGATQGICEMEMGQIERDRPCPSVEASPVGTWMVPSSQKSRAHDVHDSRWTTWLSLPTVFAKVGLGLPNLDIYSGEWLVCGRPS